MRISSLLLLMMSAFPLQEPAGDVALSGWVVDAEDGSPVPAGGVALSLDRKIYNFRLRDGRFSGQAPAGEGYSLTVRAAGFTEERFNNVSVYPGMDPITVRLRPAQTIRGQVVDPEGKGVAYAVVGLALDAEGQDVRMTARADEQGAFGMLYLTEPGIYYLVAVKGGYESNTPLAFEYPPAAELRIGLTPELGPNGSISGVATMDGKPLTGGLIVLVGPSKEVAGRARTDTRGEYQFPDLPPGSYGLELFADDPPSREPARRPVDVAAGGASKADFQLFGGRLAGHVLNAQGEPVFEVLISLSAGASEDRPLADTAEEQQAWLKRNSRRYVFHHVQTDRRGRFEFSGIGPGPYLLRSHRDHVSNHRELELSVEVPRDDLTIVLEPGLILRGVLLDRNDEILSKFGYSMSKSEGSGSFTAPVNSAQGLFLIRGLDPAVYSIQFNLLDGRQAHGFVDLNRGANVLFKMPAAGEALEVRYEKP